MSNQGTIRLKVTNSAPAIEKLWNNRFKLEFFCDNNSPKEDWYYENVSALLPEYGILQTTNFGSGVNEDWEAIPDSVYPDMHLVLSEYPYNVRAGKHYVKLTYETLTAAWVEEKDEDTDYELNGLKRVSRTFVALPATTYDKVVGISTIDSNGTTLYLGGFKIEETDAKWSLSEVWLEAGELSREENSEDAKGSISITQIGGCAAAPEGYTVVNESKNNTQGFETCSRTFYKDDSELSRSNDYVGSQLAESIEVFSPTAEPTPTNGTAVLGNKSTSNVDGIPTTRYTFLVPSVLSESSDEVGSQLAITIEAFNETPSTPAGYVIANEQTSNIEGIPTTRYTFLKPSVLSESIDNVGSQEAKVIEAFSQIPTNPAGYLLASTQVSDLGGIKTNRYTFLKNNVILSETEDKVGSELAIVQEWFNPSAEPTIGEYVLANVSISDYDGFPTKRYTFLKDNVKLSESEDKVGSQLAIVQEWFNPTDEPIVDDYVIANTQESDIGGIPTKRYTFLKHSILNVYQEFTGGATTIQVSAFGLTETDVNDLLSEITSSHILISQSEENYNGIITSKFTYEVDNFEIESQAEDGMEIIVRTQLSANNFSSGIIGTNTYEGLFLTQEEIDNGNTIKKRIRQYSEAGVLSIDPLEEDGFSLAPSYQYVTIGAPASSMSGLITPNGGSLPSNVTWLEPRVQNIEGFPTYTQAVINIPSSETVKIHSTSKFFTVTEPGTMSTDGAFNSNEKSGAAAVYPKAISQPSTYRKKATVDVFLTTLSGFDEEEVAFNEEGVDWCSISFNSFYTNDTESTASVSSSWRSFPQYLNTAGTNRTAYATSLGVYYAQANSLGAGSTAYIVNGIYRVSLEKYRRALNTNQLYLKTIVTF